MITEQSPIEISKDVDYEQASLDSLKRSWEHAAAGNNDCVAFALADAQVYAILHLARQAKTVARSTLSPAQRMLADMQIATTED